MNDATTLPQTIHIIAATKEEQPPLEMALVRTAWVLGQELGRPSIFKYTVGHPLFALPSPPPTLAIVSMLHEMSPPYAPMPQVKMRWHALLERLGKEGVSVLLCNVFRHVGSEPLGPDFLTPAALRERARRLNLLAVELSHQYEADLADIDARLAAIGARPLQDDFRLLRLGRDAAADAIVWSLLQIALFGDAGARAAARHGGIAGILARIQIPQGGAARR
jgi:hypothetical protein